ncbi:MAG: copper ion binding protein [Micrococcales bacterium]|nr:copper ion binding protein [Micrococcales bacterium]
MTKTVKVKGMTCQHCVNAIEAELGALDGVTAVMVDLVAGGTSSVAISSSAPLNDDQVAAAVKEAGYELT